MDLSQIVDILLENRGIKTDEAEFFFNPPTPDKLSSPFDSSPAIQLIKSHMESKNHIAVYGDYDVDGICSSAILWETLHQKYEFVFPHIPHRESEGYGLSQRGIDHCLEKGAKLIIAVDNGIVAYQEIEYCQSKGCDIIIIDHHEPGESLPTPNVLLHSTTACAAGLTWFFCRDFAGANNEHLSLVAIATICDMVPLLGVNRSFAFHGLKVLNLTKRPGLLSLIQEAGINSSPLALSTYEVGFILGPRLNAMGRLEHAIDSLRLLCTKDPAKAMQLAVSLGQTNKARQELTSSAITHALSKVDLNKSILIVADSSYNQGIIGLIAAKLTEKYYKPSIAISVGETLSKASARSVTGFHITEHIRTALPMLVAAGGHAMAAGFTVETSKLPQLISVLTEVNIAKEVLTRKQRVDLEIPISSVNYELYALVQRFAPFGLGNPQPIFKSRHVDISDVRQVGKLHQHSKLKIGNLEAMAFNMAQIPDNPVDITYSLDENTWNGSTKLQLVVKEIKPST
jgi:single-stranded-DNA-specific exonuclease